ncbi:LOG family protein [Candidatus Binatia bacterium]|nr:LOG family protein [Candidatus Binatia bacterium]
MTHHRPRRKRDATPTRDGAAELPRPGAVGPSSIVRRRNPHSHAGEPPAWPRTARTTREAIWHGRRTSLASRARRQHGARLATSARAAHILGGEPGKREIERDHQGEENRIRPGRRRTTRRRGRRHRLVTGAIQGLWEVVNQLTRLRRTTRDNYRVTIFGSARLAPGTLPYEAVKQLAAELTAMGCDIVTGGGPGLMRAANEGAAAAAPATAGRSVGVRVALPFEQEVNPFVGAVYEHRAFFSRLHHFMIVSDAFVVVPGGIGTLLELALAWQLLQVRKLYNVPLILVGDMWTGLVAWAREAMLRDDARLADAPDFAIPRCVRTVDETVALIRSSRAQWLAAGAPP